MAQNTRSIVYMEDGLKSTFTQKLKNEQHLKNCSLCKRVMIFKTTTAPSLDHIIPIHKGGRHIISNFRIICLSCNSSKKYN